MQEISTKSCRIALVLDRMIILYLRLGSFSRLPFSRNSRKIPDNQYYHTRYPKILKRVKPDILVPGISNFGNSRTHPCSTYLIPDTSLVEIRTHQPTYVAIYILGQFCSKTTNKFSCKNCLVYDRVAYFAVNL